MNQLSPEELIRHASSKQCTQCDTVYDKKNRSKTSWPWNWSLHRSINAIFNSKIPGEEHQLKIFKKNAKKGKFADKATRNNYNRKWSKKNNHDGEDKNSKYGMDEDDFMIPVVFHNLRGYDGQIIIKHITKDLLQKTLKSFLPPLRNSYLSKLVICAS